MSALVASDTQYLIVSIIIFGCQRSKCNIRCHDDFSCTLCIHVCIVDQTCFKIGNCRVSIYVYSSEYILFRLLCLCISLIFYLTLSLHTRYILCTDAFALWCFPHHRFRRARFRVYLAVRSCSSGCSSESSSSEDILFQCFGDFSRRS